MADTRQDPVSELREETARLRDALRSLRESVVLRVMRRSQLQDEVTQAEKRVEAIARGITLAVQANEPQTVADFTQEQTLRTAELDRLRGMLTQAEAEAESAKLSLPEDEAVILRLINDAQLHAAQRAAMLVQNNGPDGLGTNADDLWERASSKIATLRNEAAAREETGSPQISAHSSSQQVNFSEPKPTEAKPAETTLPPDQNIEQMLAELESRITAKPSNE